MEYLQIMVFKTMKETGELAFTGKTFLKFYRREKSWIIFMYTSHILLAAISSEMNTEEEENFQHENCYHVLRKICRFLKFHFFL